MAEAEYVPHLVTTIVGLLLVALATLVISKRIRLPYTVALVIAGFIFNHIAEHGPSFMQTFVEYHISPSVILFVFLPTLIFESAFNLDARQLRHNLLPVLTLAVPGLLLSTVIIGSIITLVSPFDFATSLLLGSILSATDPVAVIALFKQLGAPKRLTILVEGESLFNDATAIVVSRIIVGVMAAGYVSTETVLSGVGDFFVVFMGGILVGWLAAVLTAFMLQQVEGDAFIEISMTTILAYFSFLLAEEVFHVSGVMATVAAGVTMGGWGRTKISPSVAHYLEHFWEYMAGVANALIFLLVGMRVNLPALFDALDLMLWVIFAMLFSRAIVVYGLLPLVGKLPRSDPINIPYRHVMYWGGLRGAIALAIVLSLDHNIPHVDTLIALVMGAVLFTLLLPGLSIKALIHRLKLDEPPLSDQLSQVESLLSAKKHALKSIPELQMGGLFSASISQQLQRRVQQKIQNLRGQLIDLQQQLSTNQDHQLLFLRCLAIEKTVYHKLFIRGHLSELVYRDLAHTISLQVDHIQYTDQLPSAQPLICHNLLTHTTSTLKHLLIKTPFAEKLQANNIAYAYETAWGRHQGASHLLQELEQMAKTDIIAPNSLKAVQEIYMAWQHTAQQQLDSTASQFPEFVYTMQHQLGERMMIHAEQEEIEAREQAGNIPTGISEEMVHDLQQEIRSLQRAEIAKLHVNPEELLKKVPFFQGIPSQEFAKVASLLKPLPIPTDEFIIEQGKLDDSLFLIARGVVRVSRVELGEKLDLATLMAGDFFGEMALLYNQPRTASCRAITPCALYELRRKDFEAVKSACPSLQQQMDEAITKRQQGLELLHKVPFLHDAPVDEFQRIASLLRPRQAKSGDVVIQQGEHDTRLYLIITGNIEVSHRQSGEDIKLAILKPGDFFGETALLHDSTRNATCRCLTDCTLYELYKEDFDSIRELCPKLQQSLENTEQNRYESTITSNLQRIQR